MDRLQMNARKRAREGVAIFLAILGWNRAWGGTGIPTENVGKVG